MQTKHTARPLRIVLVHSAAEDGARLDALRSGLPPPEYEIVATLPADLFLPQRVAELQPDLLIADAESDARDVLEHIVVATSHERRPVVMFTDDETPAAMDAAMQAGVTAYVVDGLRPDRVRPVLNVALARFRQESRLLDELSDTRLKLAERKVVDRAKGMLMARCKLDEAAAYARLRSMAMNKNLKLAELAQRLLDADDLLGWKE
ncbi:MAG: ANTAR domain-containing response regulator [Telluria sp.]